MKEHSWHLVWAVNVRKQARTVDLNLIARILVKVDFFRIFEIDFCERFVVWGHVQSATCMAQKQQPENASTPKGGVEDISPEVMATNIHENL
ncbi:unnamed protein product [Toxocara canis]|uniref:Uncharacterized protein n=1 Tax=Toxocara canis TaxID=6265 RepID=A0A183UBP4_TOXCA|nr:unnamed protein product [Toxocara canis]